MTSVENNDITIGRYIVAAFCYQGLTRRKTFVKLTATHYRLMNHDKIVSYRSLHRMAKALNNAKV